VIGRIEPLPTMIDGGIAEFGGRNKEMLPESDIVWLEVPEFATKSVSASGFNVMVLKEFARDC
jgi:hypothetical protein